MDILPRHLKPKLKRPKANYALFRLAVADLPAYVLIITDSTTLPSKQEFRYLSSELILNNNMAKIKSNPHLKHLKLQSYIYSSSEIRKFTQENYPKMFNAKNNNQLYTITDDN